MKGSLLWLDNNIDRKIDVIPPYYFYWFRIDNRHMTEPWLDQALMDSAYRSGTTSVPRNALPGGRGTHDQAAYRDNNLLGKFLYDVVEFGFWLCDFWRPPLHEGTTGRGVLCPEIRELDGDFGDELGWSFFSVGHDARMYHLMVKV